MARCAVCNERGAFEKFKGTKLCSRCAGVIALELKNTGRIVADSERLIETSKNLDTKLKRCDLIISKAQELTRYEQMGIRIMDPLPSSYVEQYKSRRDQIVVDTMRELAEETKKKSANNEDSKKTAADLKKAATTIRDSGEEVNQSYNREVLGQMEKELLDLAQQAQINSYLEAADKAGFMGQKKKALNQYQEALYYIHKENESGRAVDEEVAEAIRQKLQELSG